MALSVSVRLAIRHALARLRHASKFIRLPRKGKPLRTDMPAVFVMGCGNSGTTLTAARIGRAEGVYLLGEETSLFQPRTPIQEARAVFDQLLIALKQFKATMLLEKTPKHIHAVSRILAVFPNAKFVVTVRNPLDNCASLYKRFAHKKSKGLGYAITRWNRDNLAVLNLLKSHPKQVHVVQFEKLTKDPETSLKGVFEFLSLPWQPEILEAGETAYDQVEQKRNMKIRQEQVAKVITHKENTWKDILSEQQAEQVRKKTRLIYSELSRFIDE